MINSKQFTVFIASVWIAKLDSKSSETLQNLSISSVYDCISIENEKYIYIYIDIYTKNLYG